MHFSSFSDLDELVESIRKLEICPYMTQDLYASHPFLSCISIVDVTVDHYLTPTHRI